MIVSRMVSWLYFLMSSLAFFLMVLQFPRTIILFFVCSRRFPPFLVVSSSCRARAGDVTLDFSGLLNALATLGVLCMRLFRIWCRCRLFLVVSQIGFSIRIGIRDLLWSYLCGIYSLWPLGHILFLIPPLCPVWCSSSSLKCSYIIHHIGKACIKIVLVGEKWNDGNKVACNVHTTQCCEYGD